MLCYNHTTTITIIPCYYLLQFFTHVEQKQSSNLNSDECHVYNISVKLIYCHKILFGCVTIYSWLAIFSVVAAL